MDLIKKHKDIAGTVLSFAFLMGFLATTRPSEDNFSLSFVPLVALWVFLYFLAGVILFTIARRQHSAAVALVRVTVVSTVVMVVMFSALGQLSLADVLALISLVALGSFYFRRTWRG